MGKAFWVIIALLVIGTGIIYSALQTDFSDLGETRTFVGAVFGWFKQVGGSSYEVGKTAAEQDWLPELDNGTLIINDEEVN
ncbi:MAG: hypothetical protein QF632_05775 [Candidatus Woesearchaeota archaeon]|jgi:hypothetical protein|nr:hypothetical protein [Candidatus Woesearchaeota archaeon]MDP7457288.1 hypothetical protein [Candidatus Woesearchaeota archaeon]